MQKIRAIITQHKYFLLFIFLFAYVQSIQIRFLVNNQIDAYLFTPESAIAQVLSACILFYIIHKIISKWQKTEVMPIKSLLCIFLIAIILYYMVMQSKELIIALLFDTFDRNFNPTTVINNSMMYGIDALIYGSFYIAYDYYRKNAMYQKKITTYNQALADSKIIQLKNQINPHFLFNNLNVLDQLIEEDKTKASDFLNNFAEIYRYVLQVSDQKLIAINDEIAFAKMYFEIIQQKFGNAYALQFSITNTHGAIVPLTLQLLIENVIKHNTGIEENPINIFVEIGETIVVTNTIKPKKVPHQLISGKALNNLKDQYSILTKEPIIINQDAKTFSVNIPIIKDEHYD